MPESHWNGESQVDLRDVIALLFAALCGLLLGIAAAPLVLPHLGFAGFAQFVEPTTAIRAPSTTAQRSQAVPVRHPAQTAAPSRVSLHRPVGRPAPVLKLPANARARAAMRAALLREATRSTPAPQPLQWIGTGTLVGLAALLLVFVVWLRRDMFAALLCRMAKNPRSWRGKGAPALVNARCVLYFEGNAYRLGAEFFAQSVEVRYSPLFVRINMRGSDRAIILPRRMPRVAAGLGSVKRKAAAN